MTMGMSRLLLSVSPPLPPIPPLSGAKRLVFDDEGNVTVADTQETDAALRIGEWSAPASHKKVACDRLQCTHTHTHTSTRTHSLCCPTSALIPIPLLLSLYA